jgi:hypothetical protein
LRHRQNELRSKRPRHGRYPHLTRARQRRPFHA